MAFRLDYRSVTALAETPVQNSDPDENPGCVRSRSIAPERRRRFGRYPRPAPCARSVERTP